MFANGSPNTVFLNLGDGTFVAGPTLGDGESRSVVTGDFDGDLLADIVFANSDGASLAYRNLGGGSFAAPVQVFDDPVASVRAADFNGDGLLDLILGRAVAAAPARPENLVLLNTSALGEISFVRSTAVVGASPTLKVVASDFSLDGIVDIVSLNATGTHQIFVGAAGSSFNLHPEQFSSQLPTGSTVGDFNNDDRPDIAISGAAGLQVFLNDGRGNLGSGDVDPPVVQLLGSASITLTVEASFVDPGATASDAADGDVTDRITVKNPVDTAVIGTYTVTYGATDRSGNKASPVTRTVQVQARQASGGGGGGVTGPLFIVMLISLFVLGRLSAWRPRELNNECP